MFSFNNIRELVKILILAWMPITAPMAATQCPAHQSSVPPTTLQATSDTHQAGMSDLCKQHMQQQDEESLGNCDCPSCVLFGVIPLAQSLQIDDGPNMVVSHLIPVYQGIYLNLDTPPPQRI